jgi:hypothetical protein
VYLEGKAVATRVGTSGADAPLCVPLSAFMCSLAPLVATSLPESPLLFLLPSMVMTTLANV